MSTSSNCSSSASSSSSYCLNDLNFVELTSEKVVLTDTDGQPVPAHILSCPLVASGVAAFLIQPRNPQEAEVKALG